jgi:peptidoglycan hydrolase-like protein with peptidoglycan-binding domain
MTSLAMTTVVGYAYRAGFRGADLVTAVTIAKAESGLDPHAHNGNAKTGDDSYGLWQINFLGHLRAPRLAQFHITSPADAYDPGINAHCAYVLYVAAGRKFHDWSTYNHGSHKPFIDDASAAVTQWFHDNVVAGPGPQSRPTFRRFLFLRVPYMNGATHIPVGAHSADNDVRTWQYIVGGTPDNLFGPQTDSLTRAWQKRHGLHVDGIVGPLTAKSAGITFITPTK